VADDNNDAADIFVRDLDSGVTTRVSVSSFGTEGSSGSYTPAVSADGRYVVFESASLNLVEGKTNVMKDVFLRDRLAASPVRLPATLRTPVVPSSVRLGKSVTVTGTMKPRHASGTAPVKLYFYRYEHGRYQLRLLGNVTVTNYRTTESKYSVKVKLPYKGKWRVRAWHSDDAHPASYSGYDYITVK
jgi:Tol biopolymer transport system component